MNNSEYNIFEEVQKTKEYQSYEAVQSHINSNESNSFQSETLVSEEYGLPCLLVSCTGGTTRNEVDTFTVVIDARAETDASAYEILSNALGVLGEQANIQDGALRNVTINSLARWGSDPVRPDLKLCTATVLVVAHREAATIQES